MYLLYADAAVIIPLSLQEFKAGRKIGQKAKNAEAAEASAPENIYLTSTITPLAGMMYSPWTTAPVIMSVYLSSKTICCALPE